MKAIHLFYILIIIALIALFESCEYEFIEVAQVPPPLPPDTNESIISFNEQIAPIFTDDDCVKCHNGSFMFDLTEPNAYNSIKDNNLVVAFDLEKSIIYTYPHPITGSHDDKYSTVAEADSIAKWIYQGALDN